MTVTESQKIGLQKNLLEHAANLLKEKILAHEEKIKQYEARKAIIYGGCFLGAVVLIMGVMKVG